MVCLSNANMNTLNRPFLSRGAHLVKPPENGHIAEFQMRRRRDWNPKVSLDKIGFAFHNPALAFRILFGRVTYEETLRALLNKDLAIVRKRYNSLFSDNRIFLEMPQPKLQEILCMMTP